MTIKKPETEALCTYHSTGWFCLHIKFHLTKAYQQIKQCRDYNKEPHTYEKWLDLSSSAS